MSIAVAESPTSPVELFVDTPAESDRDALTVGRVVASLQLLLAARRAARNEASGYLDHISRGK